MEYAQWRIIKKIKNKLQKKLQNGLKVIREEKHTT